MKYFLIGIDEKNKIPYNINKNRAIDIRTLTREEIDTLPMWNIMEMELPDEGFFPDLLSSPCILISKIFRKTIENYQEDIIYKGIKLWDRNSGINRTYSLTVLPELDCISEKTEFNTVGNRITRLVLDQNKIGFNTVFQIKGYSKNYIVGRLDFVESLLRRGVQGITLGEIDIV